MTPGMDHHTEMQVIAQLATLAATLESFTMQLGRIETQTLKTNGRLERIEGRVDQLEGSHKVTLALQEFRQDPGGQTLTWRMALAVLMLIGTVIGGTLSVLSFFGMLR